MTLYTDIDPYCCAVLSSRVEDGSLPPGDVMLADVRTLTAKVLRPYRHVHLFAGIGGFALGLAWAGWPESIGVVTFGFPCQDISAAGKGEGLSGSRSGLFWEARRIVHEHQPDVCFAENVGALSRRGLDVVAGAMGEAGYVVPDAYRLGAWALGAPHVRERWWIVGWRRAFMDASSIGFVAGRMFGIDRQPHGWRQPPALDRFIRNERGEWQYAGEPVLVYAAATGLQGHGGDARQPQEPQSWHAGDPTLERGWPVPVLPGYRQHDWEHPRLHQRGMGRAVHGLSGRMADALNKSGVMACGNAIVPQVCAAIAEGILAGVKMKCPKCGAEMERFDEEPDVGITGSYECECGESLPLSEGERDEG